MQKLQEIVSTFRELQSKNANVEIEARLGYSQGKFMTNVGGDYWDRIRKLLEQSKYVDHREIVEYHDFIYSHNNKQLRTRVMFNSMAMEIEKETIQKKRIQDVIFREYGESGLSIRIQVSKEDPFTDNLPSVVETDCMRITQRYSFIVGSWRYDFSRVAVGKNRMDAEDNKRKSDFQYEIECELIDMNYLNNHTDKYIAKSILHKMTNITHCEWNLSE